jgi:hypothetical protein
MSTPSPSAIETLSANAPPRQTRWKFSSVGKCHAEIKKLEVLLGLEPGRPILHIGKANAYHAELEAMLAVRGATARPGAPAPVAAIAAAVQGAVESGLPRAKKLALARVFGLLIGNDTGAEISDGKLADMLDRAAYIGCVRFPGMTADSALALLHWRKTEPAALTGIGRTFRADMQQKINSILESQ